MSPRDLEQAQRGHAALKALFAEHAGGCVDGEALGLAMSLCRASRAQLGDEECRRLLDLIEECAPAYFSEREHLDWALGSLPGVAFLRMHILRALILLHSRLERMSAGRDAAASIARRGRTTARSGPP